VETLYLHASVGNSAGWPGLSHLLIACRGCHDELRTTTSTSRHTTSGIANPVRGACWPVATITASLGG
jgi:hypothetical protein